MITYSRRILRSLIFIIWVLACLPSPSHTLSAAEADEELTAFLSTVYADRARTLIDRQTGRLEGYYFKDQNLSRNAYGHELNRTEYLNKWAAMRSLKLADAKSSIRIIRQNLSGETARISLVQSLKVSYAYTNRTLPPQSFGVGTRHFLTLKKTQGTWAIAREWYLDPLDENPQAIAEDPNGQPPSAKFKPAAVQNQRYNRTQAVAYANKYAGAAWGAGNEHHYNPKYLDYTGKGGDCTNFSSQVIGDREGGNLPMRGGWRYYAQSGGSQTWVQTDAFRDFLLYNGYGKRIARGSYEEIVSPSASHPDGAISRLQPGDLVGYILRKNDTDHFSVIVGFDQNGYPLVNSHTADRYRVPFDLGWDKNTKYELIHIRD